MNKLTTQFELLIPVNEDTKKNMIMKLEKKVIKIKTKYNTIMLTSFLNHAIKLGL